MGKARRFTLFDFTIRPETLTLLQKLDKIPNIHTYFSFRVPSSPETCSDSHQRFEAKLDALYLKDDLIPATIALLDWFAVKGKPYTYKLALDDYISDGLKIAKQLLSLKNNTTKEQFMLILNRANQSLFLIIPRVTEVILWYDYNKIATMNHNSSFGLSNLSTTAGFLDVYLGYMEGYNPQSYGLDTRAWIGFCLKVMETQGINLFFTEEEYLHEKKKQELQKKPEITYIKQEVTIDPDEQFLNMVESTLSLQKRLARVDKEFWNVYCMGNREETLKFIRDRA